MSLTNAINTAIAKFLVPKLASALAEEYELEEDEVLEFLRTQISKELKSSAKGKKAGPKGKDGKGRKTGYMLFSEQERATLKSNKPDLSFAEISQAISKKWKKVSEKEKAKWKVKANKQNEKNGLTAGAAKKPAKKTSTNTNQPKVKRDKENAVWLAEGTNFVVQSPKNKIVIGKLNKKGKVVALEKRDKEACKKLGLEIKEEEETKSKKKSKEVVEDSDDEDDDDDEESSEDDDGDSDSDDDTEED